MGIVPVFVFGILGIPNSSKINPHLLGSIVGLFLIFYALFEEYGWRGYLQDELGDIAEWKRILIIGTLWYLWHLSFLNNPDILVNLKFWGIMLLGHGVSEK